MADDPEVTTKSELKLATELARVKSELSDAQRDAQREALNLQKQIVYQSTKIQHLHHALVVQALLLSTYFDLSQPKP